MYSLFTPFHDWNPLDKVQTGSDLSDLWVAPPLSGRNGSESSNQLKLKLFWKGCPHFACQCILCCKAYILSTMVNLTFAILFCKYSLVKPQFRIWLCHKLKQFEIYFSYKYTHPPWIVATFLIISFCIIWPLLLLLCLKLLVNATK